MTLTATTKRRYSGAAVPTTVARAPLAPAWTGTRRVRVWDLPTRLFHWSLAACLGGLVITGYTGGAMMYWHARLGYTALALLLFRLVWGFVGGRWSRFRSFMYSPRRVVAYLRGDDKQQPGHNPMGALSIFAMLALLLVQVGTGLVSDDEISFTGPLSQFVAASQSLAATWYHKQIGQWSIAALVLLHVAAIGWYLVRKNINLIKPMLDGDKAVAGLVLPSRDDARSRTLAAVVFAVCAVCVAWMVRLA
jgi:cytochrome b